MPLGAAILLSLAGMVAREKWQLKWREGTIADAQHRTEVAGASVATGRRMRDPAPGNKQ